MTTIIAVQNSKGFVFAADAQVTDTERPYVHKSMKKVVEVNGYVMAGAGNSRCCDVILFGWKPPVYDGTEPYTFMVSKFIPEMRKQHEDAGITLKEDEDFVFLVGFSGKVFHIAGNYAVLETNTGLYGIGTGAAYALGALAQGATIQEAIKVAKKFDINTGGRIQIVERGYHG
jgi:ATP-dependent protease HslVU (ClpYQ) peptidase subunit